MKSRSEMNLKMLREIVQNYGFLSKDQAEALSKEAPNTEVVIRFKYGPRVSCKVSELEKTIRQNSAECKKEFKIEQSVKDVFISSPSIDKICSVFGWIK